MTTVVEYGRTVTVVTYGRSVTVVVAGAPTPDGGGGGSGDVVGPSSAVNARIAVFSGTTGKLIADGGAAISDLATAAQGALADSATQPADLAAAVANHAAATDPHADRAYTDTQLAGHVAAGDPHPGYQLESQKGAAGGYASLDGGGQIPAAQIPSIAITEYLGVAADQAAMLALTGEKGDWCTRTDTGKVWIISGDDPTQLADWTEVTYPASPVTSVAGKTGVVVLFAADISDSTAAGQALMTAADAAAQRTALSLGNAATHNYGNTAGTICEGNDARLIDARTPTAHDQGSDTITTTIKTVSTTTYTFLAEDDGKYIVFTNAAGCAATIPDTLAAGWSVGCEQEGAGQVTFGVSGSMVLGNRQSHTKTAGVRAMVSLVVKATNKITLGGDTGT